LLQGNHQLEETAYMKQHIWNLRLPYQWKNPNAFDS